MLNRHTGSEGNAAAARYSADADRVRIADLRTDFTIVDAEQFSSDVDHGCAAAADIRVTGNDERGAVLVDVQLGARFAARIAPIPNGKAAALVWPEFNIVVGVILLRSC